MSATITHLSPEGLAEQAFLQGLSRAFLSAVAPHTSLREYPTGAPIAREGDPALDFFLVLRGKVGLEMVPHDRPHLTILTLGGG